MTRSYFELLKLPEQFELDPKPLEQHYLDRLHQADPGRFAAAAAPERLAAVQRTMAINDAYQILKRPVRRAEYLLARRGVRIGDNERIADPEFLMKILSLREELA